MTHPVLTRFAPSPTGYLHVGHARAAQEAFDFATKQGGTCLLRIEDIDHTRCRPEYTQAILEDLQWLGFTWPKPVRVQSEHRDTYQSVITNLAERGVIYRCFLTRKDIMSGRTPAVIGADETAEQIATGDPFCWRLNRAVCREQVGPLTFTETGPIHTGTHAVNWGGLSDDIIARKDIGVSYHLAVTHDDAAQNITYVVRGIDLWETTPIHRILQSLMGWPEPVYYHHDIVRNPAGRKLSKRNQDTTIRALRENGRSPQDVLDMAFAPHAG